MITKHELNAYLRLRDEIRQAEERLVDLHNKSTTISAQKLTGMPTAHNASSAIEATVERIMEAEEYFRELVDAYTKQMLRIEKEIERLDPVERAIIRYRYFEGKKWEEICLLINYEWTRTHWYHKMALRKLADE